jgi:hypothetical protein
MNETFKTAMAVCAAVALCYGGATTLQSGVDAMASQQINRLIDSRQANIEKIESAVRASLASEVESVPGIFRGLVKK